MGYSFGYLYNLFDKLDIILSGYERTEHYNKSCDLFLANGKVVNYSVPKNAVAHLLGVDTNYLKSTGLFTGEFSYDILKELLTKGVSWLHKKIEEKLINPNQLFSDHIDKKIEVFNDNIRVDFKEIEFVVECKRDRIISKGYDVEHYDYIIVRKKYDKYMLLGLNENDKHNFVPSTNQLYENVEGLIENNKFRFEDQDLTFVQYGIYKAFPIGKIGDYKLDAKSKLIQLNKIKKYACEFGSTISVSGDYEYCLSKYNDSLEIKNETKITSHEEILAKYKNLQAELYKLQEVIEKQKDEIIDQNLKITNLENDNNEKKEIITSIRKLVK